MFEYLSIVDDRVLDDRFEVTLADDRDTQEDEYIKAEAFASLSGEAKEVFNTILACPSEMLDALLKSPNGERTVRRGKTLDETSMERASKRQKKRLKRYFADKWGNYQLSVVSKAFNELERFVNEFV